MYRHAPATPIKCPRCGKQMPATDPTSCECGTWLSTLAAGVVLSAAEREANRSTRWWRKREPCPHCSEQMLLRNCEPGLLQGCDVHGFFIDADTMKWTSLANGIDHAAIAAKRESEDAVAADAEARLAAEQARDAAKREKAAREADLAHEYERARELAMQRLEAEQLLAEETYKAQREADRIRREALDERRHALLAALAGVSPEVHAAFDALESRVRALESDHARLEDALRVVGDRLRALEQRH